MEYRVLARKYRPTNFDSLIGQDVLVKTLSNAISNGRIAHAFLLTGIRGVGKTTTARIIAKALNCIGEDEKGGPTITPCGVCTHCKMIAEDRHVDVLEMDAASHTGVNDIRELIDTVRYLPTSARYKVYIIDEVHMLSNSAFNALLKTLEEPPAHVKFVFATTESRKIPVTILSRCQRFDLKRVDEELMAKHLAGIASSEEVAIDEDALKLLSAAAEGSVRDALSLLDQAIAHGSGGENPTINGELVRQMLGAGDNSATFTLLELLLKGDIAGALAQLRAQYNAGGDPLIMLQEALDVTHLITRMKVAPDVVTDVTLSEHDCKSAKAIADGVSMPVVTRLWQMLLKGISEVRMAPSPISALEMLMVRLAYVAEMPTPSEVIRDGNKSEKSPAPVLAEPATTPVASPVAATEKTGLELVSQTAIVVTDFESAITLFEKNREALLYTQLRESASLVSFAPGSITLNLADNLSRDFTIKVAEKLSEWTGQPWKIIVSDEKGDGCLYEQEKKQTQSNIEDAAKNPMVADVLEQFPGATVTAVKTT